VTRGSFIAFEGLDGSGKTTALQSVAPALQDLGHTVVITREPGGTKLGRQIRELVLNGRETMQAETELLLMCADRAEHVRSVIRPALREGKIVISDRYAASSIVYQGYGRGLSLETVRRALAVATGGLQPDLTILLDLTTVEAHQRRSGDPMNVNQLDQLDDEIRDRMRSGYLALAASEPNWSVIDATGSAEPVAKETLKVVTTFLARCPA